MPSLTTTVPLPLDQAETAGRTALADHGFGVLTEIDVIARLAAAFDDLTSSDLTSSAEAGS